MMPIVVGYTAVGLVGLFARDARAWMRADATAVRYRTYQLGAVLVNLGVPR